MDHKRIILNSLADLEKAAGEVLDFAKGEKILLFRGEMAAGKTTLIKEICRQAGVTEPVSSPTFALVNEYGCDQGGTIYHFDFYRINAEEEALDIGVTEYLDSGCLCLIEWPANIAGLLPEKFVEVIIDKGIGEARAITLKRN
jgi:tRNA threonylcarbamoyladenosine biosynthesis protein TsaE